MSHLWAPGCCSGSLQSCDEGAIRPRVTYHRAMDKRYDNPADSKVRLWLDDLRPVPDGWTWAKTVEEAISLMEGGRVTEASLDHDLGEGTQEGHRLVLWMAENGIWPSEAVSVHSSNPPGAERMCAVIERYGPYRRGPGTRKFVAE